MSKQTSTALQATFQHVAGISAERERRLWASGITSWEAYRRQQSTQLVLFENGIRSRVDRDLQESIAAFRSADVKYFADRLPPREHYRIADAFPAHTVFLDIETTGLSQYYDHITLVGWSARDRYGFHVAGGEQAELRRTLQGAKILVTFNGSRFDLPFMRKTFADLRSPLVHVDLRYLARRVGLTGSQKEIEATIGFKRDVALAGIDGSVAPVLWHQYCYGDLRAIRLLIAYNLADIQGMQYLLDRCARSLLEREGVPREIRPSHAFMRRQPAVSMTALRRRTQALAKKVSSYTGQIGPRVTYENLVSQQPGMRDLRVVGIDLTGSEQRASGWCLLAGSSAFTKLIRADKDLLSETLAADPDLVSIDSPLSLPRGRQYSSDADPTRGKFGIMRLCERELRRRGVSVYPCLIPSMQKLTERGISLARTLRSHGIPVIESYPGAAQDIMGIPRKRASFDLLRRGLEAFGITTPWGSDQPAHDELDALTSAIVGLFFWSDNYEALGERDEGLLIIPRLGNTQAASPRLQVVGLSGPIAAGKTTISRMLDGLPGYMYTRFSAFLAEMLVSRGVAVSRKTLQQIGTEIHAFPGQRWLALEIIKQLAPTGHAVIDGLRHPEDHATLVEEYGPRFLHVHLDAPESARRARYVALGNSETDFVAASRNEAEADVGRMRTLAHCILPNTGDPHILAQDISTMTQTDRNDRRKEHYAG